MRAARPAYKTVPAVLLGDSGELTDSTVATQPIELTRVKANRWLVTPREHYIRLHIPSNKPENSTGFPILELLADVQRTLLSRVIPDATNKTCKRVVFRSGICMTVENAVVLDVSVPRSTQYVRMSRTCALSINEVLRLGPQWVGYEYARARTRSMEIPVRGPSDKGAVDCDW
jgi:hypothetical protein